MIKVDCLIEQYQPEVSHVGWMAKSGGRSEEGVAGTKRQKGAPTYYLAKRKLRENERNWTKGMSVPGDPLPRSGNGNICAFLILHDREVKLEPDSLSKKIFQTFFPK